MNIQKITVTHVLDTGTSFGVTMASPPIAVFIPGKVAAEYKLEAGQIVEALLVPNAHQPEKTPLLATRIVVERKESVEDSVAMMVRRVMKRGGVWTVATMRHELYPDVRDEEATRLYNAISSALRAMFARGDCAKFQLWRSPDQSKAGREWFSCYPEKADVDEWID
jgi:hypothetical protein